MLEAKYLFVVVVCCCMLLVVVVVVVVGVGSGGIRFKQVETRGLGVVGF